MNRRGFLVSVAATPFVGPSIADLLVSQQAALPTGVYLINQTLTTEDFPINWKVFKARDWDLPS